MPVTCGERATKFGIYEDRLDEAVDAARRHALPIDTIHVHAGSGWLADLDMADSFRCWGRPATQPGGR